MPGSHMGGVACVGEQIGVFLGRGAFISEGLFLEPRTHLVYSVAINNLYSHLFNGIVRLPKLKCWKEMKK